MELMQGFPTAPGCCFTCRTADGRLPSIDTRRDDRAATRRENVYICAPCVRAMAKMLEPGSTWRIVENAEWMQMAETNTRANGWRERAEVAERTLAMIAEHLPTPDQVPA